MKVTRNKIIYHNGIHSDTRYIKSETFEEDQQWLIFVPWDLDVETRKGIHAIRVKLKSGGENMGFLKEKVDLNDKGSYWTLYDLYNELEIVKTDEIEES
jgi:hypothetical protein